MRGLKLKQSGNIEIEDGVAPYVGAWIETYYDHEEGFFLTSHPTWVRGLKLRLFASPLGYDRSHPTWVRGLKPTFADDDKHPGRVAPYVGAWIETSSSSTSFSPMLCRTLRGCVD